jgi:K+-transporting ATPase ATPase A chain
MNANSLGQCALYLAALLALAWPLGAYMARVYDGRPCGLDRVFGPMERLIYRVCGVDPKREMDWKTYTVALMVFAGASLVALYAQLRLQDVLPLNPDGLGPVAPDLAFNTAISFCSNTSWQSYAGEGTMSYLSQAGLAVHMFLSAATGMAVLAALIRGFARRETEELGNFWLDLVRGTLYILMPLAVAVALALAWQGVPQTIKGAATATILEPTPYGNPVKDASGRPVLDKDGKPKTEPATMTEQIVSRGPVAFWESIKMLSSDGGGYFNVNAAHPFENPTPFSNFLEMLAILIIPAGFCFTFGIMVLDQRQGLAILAAMTIMFVALLVVCVKSEQAGNPRVAAFGVDQRTVTGSMAQPGGNMEGKESRFGVVDSALMATAGTASSSGAVNAMLDSFTPLGGLVPLWLMHLCEVVYGGVGSGLYSMLVYVIVTVFVAGLLVGRMPQYLGKKIEPFEMKMASVVILIPPFLSLIGTALGMIVPDAKAAIANPGAHGFSEILYAFTSMSNNNGSAFAGLSANMPFYNTVGGLCMFIARYWLIVPTLAIAGAMAVKRTTPEGAGTLPTHTPLFVFLLIVVVTVVGALSVFPAMALGPIAEHLILLE